MAGEPTGHRDLFDGEFRGVVALIGERPALFPVTLRIGERDVRRALMERTACHLYFWYRTGNGATSAGRARPLLLIYYPSTKTAAWTGALPGRSSYLAAKEPPGTPRSASTAAFAIDAGAFARLAAATKDCLSVRSDGSGAASSPRRGIARRPRTSVGRPHCALALTTACDSNRKQSQPKNSRELCLHFNHLSKRAVTA